MQLWSRLLSLPPMELWQSTLGYELLVLLAMFAVSSSVSCGCGGRADAGGPVAARDGRSERSERTERNRSKGARDQERWARSRAAPKRGRPLHPRFGLWRICFPPILVRTGRRLPVQALGERGVLVSVTGYPRGGAPGPG